MAENEIIERICGSCNCDEATAKEYLNDEIRHLRELQEVNDLQESDIELSCSGLGIESECMEYFTMVLTYWKIQCKLPPKTKRFCPLVLK